MLSANKKNIKQLLSFITSRAGLQLTYPFTFDISPSPLSPISFVTGAGFSRGVAVGAEVIEGMCKGSVQPEALKNHGIFVLKVKQIITPCTVRDKGKNEKFLYFRFI